MSKYFSDSHSHSHSHSHSQSQSLSAALIQYPHIEFTTNTKSVELIQNPPSVALHSANQSATISQSAANEGQSQTHVSSAKCSSHNDDGDVIIRTQFLIPTRNKEDYLNCSYDESYFPAELCINWNMIQAARMDSSSGLVSETHSRAADAYHPSLSDIFGGSHGFCASKSDMSFFEFVRESPRAMAYTTFLASLQQNFSQQVTKLASVTRARSLRVLILFVLASTILIPGIILLSLYLTCNDEQNDEQKSSQNGDDQVCLRGLATQIIAGVLIVIGLVFVVYTAAIAYKQKRLFLEELEKRSCALTLCGHDVYESANSQTLSVPCASQQQEQQKQQQEQEQQLKGWHAEVRFEAGAETLSVNACFIISWKNCNEQCAQHRSSYPLVQVVVDRNGSGHTQSQSLSQSQSQSH